MSMHTQKLYTARQSQHIDTICHKDFDIDPFDLMQKAGASLFEDLKEFLKPHSQICIFCGPGNNAGDGFICGELAAKQGYSVTFVLLQDESAYKNQALQAFNKAKGCQAQFTNTLPKHMVGFDVIVDALFGSGLSRNVDGDYAQAIELINDSDLPILAADIPSGLCADTGSILSTAVKACKTSSFITLKQGQYTRSGPDCCGQICFHDLNIPKEAYTKVPHASELLNASLLNHKLDRNQNTHKGSFGHSLLIGGFEGMMGAILIAARACLRAGSGLVTVATSTDHQSVLTTAQPEVLTASAFNKKQMQEKMKTCEVIAIGPGLDTEEESIEVFLDTIQTDKPLVIDADALNILSQNPQHKNNWILTPHPKEASRLLNCSVKDIQENRFKSAKELQQKYGGVIILKGCGTIICDAKQNLFVSPHGNPFMATGGMGDALTGILTALLAQGFQTDEAAKLAVIWHGLTADKLFAKDHQTILATDLIKSLRMDE